jgi:hypothetical protein
VFFMHSASAVDIYRAQRKHINYSIWPMRISRHDLRRRYSNSLVIDAGSQFTLRACSQATPSAKPKDPVQINRKAHVVFSLQCGDCEEVFWSI